MAGSIRGGANPSRERRPHRRLGLARFRPQGARADARVAGAPHGASAARNADRLPLVRLAFEVGDQVVGDAGISALERARDEAVAVLDPVLERSPETGVLVGLQ